MIAVYFFGQLSSKPTVAQKLADDDETLEKKIGIVLVAGTCLQQRIEIQSNHRCKCKHLLY